MGKTTARQDVVDLRHAERQAALLLCSATLEGSDAFAKVSNGQLTGSRHRFTNPSEIAFEQDDIMS